MTTVLVRLGARPECAAAALKFDRHRAWATPDEPGRYAITIGGSEEQAHAAAVVELRERFVGDWSYEATLMAEAPSAEPCVWCTKHGQYAH